MNQSTVKRPEKSEKMDRAKAAKTYQKNDESSKPPVQQEALFETYLPLVKSIVARIKINLPPHIDEQDLHSVGITGLINALKKYDPDQKKSFGSYAAMRIRGAILDELRRMDWMPRNARTNFKKLRRTIEDLEQKLGRPAEEEEEGGRRGLGGEQEDAAAATNPKTPKPQNPINLICRFISN